MLDRAGLKEENGHLDSVRLRQVPIRSRFVQERAVNLRDPENLSEKPVASFSSPAF